MSEPQEQCVLSGRETGVHLPTAPGPRQDPPGPAAHARYEHTHTLTLWADPPTPTTLKHTLQHCCNWWVCGGSSELKKNVTIYI